MRCRWMALVLPPFLSLFLLHPLFLHHHQPTNPIIPSLGLDSTTSGTKDSPPLRIFIGILTLPDNYERRNLLRMVYNAEKPDPSFATVDVRFVFCNLSKPEQHVFVSLEIRHYNDIVILNCTENMNEGKTYTYFSSLARVLPGPYDYVMKADDDAFIRLQKLTTSLMPLPRTDLYYGFLIPCDRKDPYAGGTYMSGMGFVLSWDLVEWIATSDIPPKNKVGPEDKMVGRWLAAGKKAKNRVSEKPGMYDFPASNVEACAHGLIPETVMVHRVKRWDQWRDVLLYFNVTSRIVGPSPVAHGVAPRS